MIIGGILSVLGAVGVGVGFLLKRTPPVLSGTPPPPPAPPLTSNETTPPIIPVYNSPPSSPVQYNAPVQAEPPAPPPPAQPARLTTAQRILRSAHFNADNANPQVKMGEMFADILSEMRAYGQRLAIIDQVPSKLVLDALKNTNLKIVHRLVAADDCR